MHGTRLPVSAVMVTVVAVLATAVTAAGVATAGALSGSPLAQQLRATELERLQALVDANTPVLERLLADDFQLIPPPGVPLSRNDYVAAVAAGAIDYRVFEPISDMKVRLYGRGAAIRYLSHIDVTVAGLGHFDVHAWVTDVYEKNHGQWQILWEQATAVGGFPPSGP